MSHKYTNLLIHETSPYLLQHAHNPVNWHPWGEEALQKARAEQKIILVSIGYSACHWCHVMEKESFEDEATAALMNEHFVNIKIDREERPDIDHIYMDAVQAMTGSGGWPLNVFLTPEAKPFYGGTYFPPVQAFNRASWKEVLQGVQHAWQEKKAEIISQAHNLTEHIAQSAVFSPVATEGDFSTRDCAKMYTAVMQSADKEWGGFGRAPKFPQTFTISYLLEYFHFTKEEQALSQALLSLDKMLQGGIYDHIAGGLARYSTDTEWLAPHFEKMLYDNALLVIALCDAWQITGKKVYEQAIHSTLSFVLNEMTDASGGFYSALDADSEGEEGRYYVWSKQEIQEVLKEDADLFCKLFDVSVEGNWEGKNILRLLQPITAFAKQKGLNENELVVKIQGCIKLLHQVRKKRVRPGLDDKIILGWNALMIKAFCKAAVVLKNEQYRRVAVNNIDFLLENFKVANSEEMYHTYKNGVAKYPAFLDDYAFFIDACCSLYEATFEEQYLKTANNIMEYVCRVFSDEASIFFYYTANHQKDVIVRKKEMYDGALPSPNAVMTNNLLKLGILFNKYHWQERSVNMLKSLQQAVVKYPTSFAVWAAAIQQLTYGINEIAVVGPGAKNMSEEIVYGHYIPNKIIAASNTINNNIPFLSDKKPAETANIYLCKNRTCLPPFKNVEQLVSAISTTKF